MTAAVDTVIAWTPVDWNDRYDTHGQVRLAPRPPYDAVKPYAFWLYSTDRAESREAVLADLFIRFNTMVVRDGIDPKVAHTALLGIDEYREAVSPEIRDGAR